MAELPFMPLAVESWDADTSHLTDAQDGLYGRLVRLMWKAPGQRLPNDDGWLAHKLGRSLEAVQSEVRPLIAEFFKSDGNWITHKRVAKEWRRARKSTKQRSEAAKARWNKNKEASERNAAESKVAMIPTPTPTPTPTEVREDLTTPSPVAARDDDDPIGWPSGHDGTAPQLRPPSDHRSRGQRTAGDVLERLMPQTGPPEKRLKRQDRADQDMANWLITRGGMDAQRAWALLIAARDPEDPEHTEAARELEGISRKHKLGFFTEERHDA